MKPICLLDMDGVLAGFDERCWAEVAKWGWPTDIAGPAEQTAYYMTEHLVERRHRRRLRSFIDESRWFRDLPVIEGSQDGVAMLEQHFDVWVCTKPLATSHSCAGDKQAWVKEHFPSLHGKIILASDKSMVVGDLLIDDYIRPEQAERALWSPITFARPYNTDGPGLRWAWGDPVEPLLTAAELAREERRQGTPCRIL